MGKFVFPEIKGMTVSDWVRTECVDGDNLKVVKTRDESEDGLAECEALQNTRTKCIYVIGSRYRRDR